MHRQTTIACGIQLEKRDSTWNITSYISEVGEKEVTLSKNKWG